MVKAWGTACVESLHWLWIWEQELIPEDWKKGILIYKGKDCRTDCGSYRGIKRLSIPGKLFARLLLDRIQKLLCWKRRTKQSGYTPGRSTINSVLSLNLIAQRKRECRKPTYAAYACMWTLMLRLIRYTDRPCGSFCKRWNYMYLRSRRQFTLIRQVEFL